MDYKGQELSENLFFWIIIIFGAIGWIYGYLQQDFTYVFYAWCVGMVLSIVVCFNDITTMTTKDYLLAHTGLTHLMFPHTFPFCLDINMNGWKAMCS